MGTQGLIAIVDGGQTILKAVCGCDGCNAEKLARKIATYGVLRADFNIVYEFAELVGFGCPDCLIVWSRGGMRWKAGYDLPARYWETFDNPTFNPRWEQGTASHVWLIDCESGAALAPAGQGRAE